MGSFSVIVAFIVGVFLTGGLSLMMVKRRVRELEAQLEEKSRLMQKELAVKGEEARNQFEQAYRKRAEALESSIKEREFSVRAREEEASNNLAAANRDRELLEKRRRELDQKYDSLEKTEDRLRETQSRYRSSLQDLSGISSETAREQLFNLVQEEIAQEVREMREERLSRSEKEIEQEARRTLIACMQRMSAVPHEDITATIVPIPSDDMKGRIIGREGRNIKSFESLTGTTLLIDETPDSVLVSSFDPVRREIARLALEALIKDGRIHPSSIEEAVNRADEDVKKSVVDSGEDALRRLRLTRMHPEVVGCLGKLRFRLSNNQNSLEHSIEVANLCSLMASELGLDTEIAKRAGLLHDIGKVLDQDHEGSHALAGSYFLKRLGTEDPRIFNAVAAHHGEVPAESAYVALVMIADSLSAARPGVRADSLEGYLQRVRSLEEIAGKMEGVSDAYAIQAGREIRVIISPDALTEKDAAFLARKIRRRIEDELQYPGTIRVTVIREQRFSETAT